MVEEQAQTGQLTPDEETKTAGAGQSDTLSEASEGASDAASSEPAGAGIAEDKDVGEGLKVELNWAGSPGASGYNVKRSTTSGGPYTVVASNIPEPSYTDTTVLHGLTYHYVVSAVNEGGESANSAEMSFTPVSPPSPPGAPLATAGSSQVSLSWAGSSRAVSYNVKRASQQGGPYTTVGTGVSTTEYTDTTAVNGITYYYVVSAVNDGGESFDSSEVSSTPLAPPAPVSGLAAFPGSAQVSLTWAPSPGATTYTVKRSTVRGGHYGTIAMGVGATAYIDTTVTNGTPYYYVVSAANPGGESSNSAEVAAKPVAPPAPPTGLLGTPGNGEVALTWTASAGAASYNVKRAATTDGLYTTIATPVLDTAYTDLTVTNGLTYYYVVTALNAGGESPNSAEALAAPSAPPGPVEGLDAASGNAQVTLNWSPTEGAAGYNIKRSNSANGPYTLVAGDLLETSYTDTTVTNGTTYYYLVTARNVGGESASSAQVSALPVAPPEAVTELTATPGNAQVILSWEASEGAASYTVKRVMAPGGHYTTLVTGLTDTTFTDTDVTNGTTYHYVVSAGNVGGESPDSAPVVVQPVSPPGAPASLTSSAGNAQVVLSWTGVAGAVSYNLKRSAAAGGPYTTVMTGVTTPGCTDTTAANGRTYYYVVSAVNQGGESPDSNEIAATPVEPPAAPVEVNALAGNARVTLSWGEAPGAVSYLVKRSIVRGGRYTTLAMGVTTTGYMDTSVANGTPYYYVISAVNAGGESPDSVEVAARPVAPPGVVTGVKAAPGNGRVQITWTASPGAASYSVKRSGGQGGPFTTIATPLLSTTYTDTTVTNGAVYYYVVSGSNAGGESQNSAEVGAAPVSPPRAVEGVRAAPGNSQVTLNWTGLPDAASYNVKRSSYLGGPYSLVAADITETTYLDRDVVNAATYYYVVSAANAGGESSNSTEASARPVAPPSGIEGLTALPGNEQVTVYWTGLPGSISYNVKRSRNPGGPYSPIATGLTEMTHTDTAVSNATPYYYVVSAMNAGGESEDSAEVMAEPVAPPSAVTGLKGAPHNARVTLSWTPLPGVTSYNIKRSTNAGGPYDGVATGVTGHSYSDGTVTNGIDYYYVVSAENAGGEGPDSSEVRVAPVAPPAAITALTATPGNSQVVLNWMESARANTYNIKRSADPAGPFEVIAEDLTETTYTDIGVTNGTEYYYVVSGVNAGGEGANSIEAIARPMAAPSPVSGLSAVPGNTQVELAWTPSPEAASYNVKRSATRGGRYINLALGVTGASYTDTAVNNGTNYYYVVSAVNAGGESANSAEAHGRPAPPPAVPTGLIAAPGALEMGHHSAAPESTGITDGPSVPAPPPAPAVIQQPIQARAETAEAAEELETPTPIVEEAVPEPVEEEAHTPVEAETSTPDEEPVEEAAPVVHEPMQPVEVPAAVTAAESDAPPAEAPAITEAPATAETPAMMAEAAAPAVENPAPPVEVPTPAAPVVETAASPTAGIVIAPEPSPIRAPTENLPRPPAPPAIGTGSGLMQPPAPAIMNRPAAVERPAPEPVQDSAPAITEPLRPVEIPTAAAAAERTAAEAAPPAPLVEAPAAEASVVEAPVVSPRSAPTEALQPAQLPAEVAAAVSAPTPVESPITESPTPRIVEPAPSPVAAAERAEPAAPVVTPVAVPIIETPPAPEPRPAPVIEQARPAAASPTPAPVTTPAPAAETGASPQVSPAIREALNRNAQLLLPLVVGKYADRDIMSDSGERIIARGQQISEPLAQSAGQQGKLYDLWVAAQPTQPEGAA